MRNYNDYVKDSYLTRKCWYVVQTKNREEEKAAFFLRQKNIEIYLPKMEVVVFHAGKSKLVHKPLFPQYIFARFVAKESLHEVRWTRGVAKILLDSANPTPIKDELIEKIKALEHPDGIIRKRHLRKDDKIKITRGPFKDIYGIFECWTSDKGRVRVLLFLAFGQARVELHHSLIEKVE